MAAWRRHQSAFESTDVRLRVPAQQECKLIRAKSAEQDIPPSVWFRLALIEDTDNGSRLTEAQTEMSAPAYRSLAQRIQSKTQPTAWKRSPGIYAVIALAGTAVAAQRRAFRTQDDWRFPFRTRTLLHRHRRWAPAIPCIRPSPTAAAQHG